MVKKKNLNGQVSRWLDFTHSKTFQYIYSTMQKSQAPFFTTKFVKGVYFMTSELFLQQKNWKTCFQTTNRRLLRQKKKIIMKAVGFYIKKKV